MSSEKKQRAPARRFTTLDDHEALDHARWSYARMRHLARLVNSGEGRSPRERRSRDSEGEERADVGSISA